MSVILSHADIPTVAGGFIGVDIFFVISGYLIMSLIVEDRGELGLMSFYERRARRIIPALYFTLIFCTLLAWIWLLPHQLKDFGNSLTTASLFLSNFYFWQTSGYFAIETKENPLSNTWSLSVQAQFYLLSPVFF